MSIAPWSIFRISGRAKNVASCNGYNGARTNPHRPATKAEASALAVLVDIAGEGLPAHLWSTLKAPGELILRSGASAPRLAGVVPGRIAAAVNPAAALAEE